MRRSTHSPAAFTVVELLVVVGIIGILVGLLVPALGGISRRAQKTKELNNIRQVGLGWTAYSSNNNDAAIPGFLSAGVQDKWNVSYQLPDRSVVPPAPNYGTDPNVAGSWVWRLMPYLSYNLETLRGYLDTDTETDITVIRNGGGGLDIAKMQEIAAKPAFGYNGIYVGGHWNMYRMWNGSETPRYRYFDVRASADNNIQLQPVSTSIAGIHNPDERVVFCASTKLITDSPVQQVNERPDVYLHQRWGFREGSDLVMPPIVAETAMWSRPGMADGGGFTTRAGSVYDIQVLDASAHFPIGRHNGLVPVFWADGHVDQQTASYLQDQKFWMNNVREVNGEPARFMRHTENAIDPID